MLKPKVLATLIILFCMMFVVFEINGNGYLSSISSAFVVPLFTILYMINVKEKTSFFITFLVAYSISDLLALFAEFLPFQVDYYLGNSLYMLAYVALAIEIVCSINFKQLLSHFKPHIFVLIVLNIYANSVLFNIESESVTGFNLGFEVLYNVFVLSLLSVALMNYFYRDDRKAYMLFLGSICITVSEVIQIAYFYIPEVEGFNYLNISSSLILIAAFFFYYYQSRIDYDELLLYA